jgi:hypothetical protein
VRRAVADLREREIVNACELVTYEEIDICTVTTKTERKLLLVCALAFLSMESIIEVQRSLHEERERSLDLVVKEFVSDKKNVSLLFHLSSFLATRASEFRASIARANRAFHQCN